jgi:hypothetical protein
MEHLYIIILCTIISLFILCEIFNFIVWLLYTSTHYLFYVFLNMYSFDLDSHQVISNLTSKKTAYWTQAMWIQSFPRPYD